MFLFLFQAGGLGGALIPMLLIFGVFYLLLIRPQQKKQRQLQATIAELKAGDKVITTGGVIGTITAVRDASFFIRSVRSGPGASGFGGGFGMLTNQLGSIAKETKSCPAAR